MDHVVDANINDLAVSSGDNTKFATTCDYYHTPRHRHGLRNIYFQPLLKQFESVVGGELRLPDPTKRTADTCSNEKMLRKRAHVLLCL
jgi:hypothetical protein